MGSMYASEQSVEKLIVSSSKDEAVIEENLLKLKVYLLENPSTRMLQEKYALDVKMEHFAQYNAVVISPIDSLDLRNALLVLLSPVFPDIFYIEETKVSTSKKDKLAKSPTVIQPRPTRHTSNKTEENWVNEIGLQWLAIWLLAVVGLVLSIRSRRKMAHLNKTQTEIKANQTKIEKEIKALGDEDA
jgi:hypothetical protein